MSIKTVMETGKLIVGGNILKEVSSKLPNMFIALNELLKNSYDACATTVEVILSTNGKYLIIKDDGKGMDKKAIQTLTSVASSTKKYGVLNECNRITQGSKGLGFLSVYKFGHIATWETVHNNQERTLSIDIRKFEHQNDVSNTDLEIELVNFEEKRDPYTLIKIDMNDDSINEFRSTFIESEENLNRLLHSFNDETFIIKINFDNEIIRQSSPKKTFNENFNKKITYKVLYSTASKKITFKHNNTELFTEIFNVDSNRFQAELDLEIYDLKGDSVDNADPLFIFRSTNKRIIAPIVYINNNIFHSYELFDPNISRPIKSSIVLAQMAGFIKIKSIDPELEFNSERTKLVESSFSRELVKFLQDINIKIQTLGSENKFGITDTSKIIYKNPSMMKPLSGDSYESNISTILDYSINPSFRFKSKIVSKIDANKIEFCFADKKLGTYDLPKLMKDIIYPAEIKLTDTFIVLNIPNPQIHLRNFIQSANNSKNESVVSEVKIYIDNVESTDEILPNYEDEKYIDVDYVYIDAKTGRSISRLKIEVKKPAPRILDGSKMKNKFIPNYAKPGYNIKFSYHVSRLLNQINSLYDHLDSKGDQYESLYAVSLRALFDLSIESIKANITKPGLFNGDIYKNVNDVISLLTKKVRTEMATNLGVKITTLNSILLLGDSSFTLKFGEAARMSNLTAHGATKYVTTLQVEEIASRIGWFLLFVNELITDAKIKTLI